MGDLDKKETDFDLGGGKYLRWITLHDTRVGFFFFHNNPQNGESCLGTVYFKNHPTETVKWQFNGSFESPSVFPSIRCLSCGTHGFLEDGKWREV